jgi:3-hydroxy acid dehydrogenase/malonic semialdehyde reductase
VVATARRADRLHALAAELGDAVLPVELDVQDAAAVEQAFAALPESHREVDVLINNAGLAIGLEPAQSGSMTDWDQVIRTNCQGVVFCTRAALPGMIERRRGHVINIGSVAANYPYPGGNVYGATKAFVQQFSLNLRADLHGAGVRVTCIEPGLVGGTEFSEVRFRGDADKARAVYADTQPLRPKTSPKPSGGPRPSLPTSTSTCSS